MQTFFAYPSHPKYLDEEIRNAAAEALPHGVNVHVWPENDVAGRPLIEPILEHVDDADFVFADVTTLNFNVTFEIGYAISKSKRVYLTRSEKTPVDEIISRVGLFDTLGVKTYGSATELARLLNRAVADNPIATDYFLERRKPVYLVLPSRPDELTSQLQSQLARTGYKARTFTPLEDTRMAAIAAVESTLSSFGVVVPLLSADHPEATIHNQRAAFVAGLAFGADIPLLATQLHNGPIPIDVRDFVATIRHPKDLIDPVQQFATAVTARAQQNEGRPAPNLTALAALSLGDPMAENELDTIDHYFLQTDAYLRAERGELRLVVGRKGTGKTAIFGHLSDRKRRNPRNVVVDLKPEGYQLFKLRDGLLNHLAFGSRYHLLVAFWEMILYLELCNKILVDDDRRHVSDHRLFEPYNRLKARYLPYLNSTETDFSERLKYISDGIVGRFDARSVERGGELSLSNEEVTNLLYETDIRAIRDDISRYLGTKERAVLLFDNLDRGWPDTGLTSDDILIVRSLVEASSKLQREMRQRNIDFSSIVFLRNDVYQILMRSTPDFGKDLRAQLDWTDPDQIRELVRLRLANALGEPKLTFEQAWRQICVSHIRGEETFSFLLDRSLYRPRNVLKLIYHCRASAINLRKDQIDEDDLGKGITAFSQDILLEVDRELTDIVIEAKSIIYQFMGESSHLGRGEVDRLLTQKIADRATADIIIDRLLYIGFLGIERAGSTRYIYNVGYNMEIFATEMSKFASEIRFVVNPAFRPALYIDQVETSQPNLFAQ